MRKIRLWAPFANEVFLCLDDRKITMSPLENHWWQSDMSLNHGQDYSIMVDERGPFPDPRSPWQPDGIHAASRVYDHSRYTWQCRHWQTPSLQYAIIYELHIGTFTPEGTFTSAITKLDYLKELGITHICIMPVATFSGSRGWGYDGVQLFAPHPAYGTPDDFKQFIDQCHCRDINVIIDVVYNHLGPSGNYLSQFGPYFTATYQTPWGEAVNFDEAYSHEVRQFFIDNALMWLRDYQCDGLRLDAVHAIFDRSAEHFLASLTRQVKNLEQIISRPLDVIAESDLNDPRLLYPTAKGGYALDSQWCDDLHHSLHAYLTGENQGYYADFGSIAAIAKSLDQAYVYDGQYSTYRNANHGAKPEGLSSHNFIVYTQTHDQIGNRAKGERLCHLIEPNALKLAAAIVLTSPFTPMIFQGEEWAASSPFLYFTDHQEPELGKAVSEGRQREFQSFDWVTSDIPDPQAIETFRASQLNWQELAQKRHHETYQWYRELITFRKNHPELTTAPLGSATIELSEKEHWLIIDRGLYLFYYNMGHHSQLFSIDHEQYQLTLASSELIEQHAQRVLMPAMSIAIFNKKEEPYDT